MPGFLVPPWYHEEDASEDTIRLSLLTVGFFMAVASIAFVKVLYHSYWFWARSLRPNEYLVMVWVLWIVSTVAMVVMWLFLIRKIEPSFWLFLGFVCAFAIQTQVTLNILIHILQLIIESPSQSRRLKWSASSLQLLIIIPVFVIWIPARLQISDTYVLLSGIWAKVVAIGNLVLNWSIGGYLVFLLQRRCAATRSQAYFWTDCFWKVLTLVLILSIVDVVFVVGLSIQDNYFYMFWQPTIAMIKLYTHMAIAGVIVPILYPGDGGETAYDTCEDLDFNSPPWNEASIGTSSHPLPSNWHPDMNWWPWTSHTTTITSDHTHAENETWTGIQKTVETDVRHEWVVLHHLESRDKDRMGRGFTLGSIEGSSNSSNSNHSGGGGGSETSAPIPHNTM